MTDPMLISLAKVGAIASLSLAAIGSALGTGAAGCAAVGAWKKCYAQNKAAPFLLIAFVGAPLSQTIYGMILMLFINGKANSIPAFGWQMVFIIGGLSTLVMVVVVILFLPESLHYLMDRRPKNALQQANRILSRLGRSSITEMPEILEEFSQPGISEIFSPALKKSTLLLWLSFFMSMLTLYFLLLWTPQIIVNAGLPKDQGILVGATLNVGGLAGMLLLGYFAARFGLHRLIIVFFLMAAISMVAFALIDASAMVLLLLAFAIGFFTIGGMIGLYSVAADMYPTTLRNTGLGWGIGIGRLGAILGPYAAGVLMGIGWEQADYFLLLALPLVFAMISTLALKKSQARTKQ